jgi:hypothetical protein
MTTHIMCQKILLIIRVHIITITGVQKVCPTCVPNSSYTLVHACQYHKGYPGLFKDSSNEEVKLPRSCYLHFFTALMEHQSAHVTGCIFLLHDYLCTTQQLHYKVLVETGCICVSSMTQTSAETQICYHKCP